ncbi:MAG: copper ion binding protein [Acidobacteria bacterium]|nr:copper ion binding protein [Acidobacteriota bacterium]
MRENTTLGAAVLAAITASLCCLGPLVAALLGLGSFGAAALFEAWRPYLVGVTFALLGAAFYFMYRKREVACADGTCKVSSAPRWNKVSLWVATVVVILFAAFPYYSGPLLAALYRNADQKAEQPASPSAPAPQLTKARLTVSGMTCGGCAASLEAALADIPGVVRAKASYEKGEAIVEYDAARVTTEQLKEAVNKAAFKAEAVKVISPNQVEAVEPKSQLATATIRVEGMTCGGCAALVHQVLAKREGVKFVEVNLEKKQAIVKYDPAKVTPKQLAEAINQTGFKAKL